VTALFSREEEGERVQTQVDNLPNEHGGSSISGFGNDGLPINLSPVVMERMRDED
jgi:hypothetical protein